MEPFRAVLAAMVGTEDLSAHARSTRGATEAAALFYPDAIEPAATAINERLAQLGVQKVNHKTLENQIRQLVGGQQGENAKISDAKDAVEAFLEHLRGELGLGQAVLPLRFFRADWYAWMGRVWQQVDDVELHAQATAFLQQQGLKGITRTFVQDLMANLEGLTLLKYVGVDPPFHIESESPFQISQPKRVVFETGFIDLDEAATTRHPTLYPHSPAYFNIIQLPFAFEPDAKEVAARQAKVVRDLHIPATLGIMIGSDAVGALGSKAHFDQIMIAAGNPTDPIERMMLEQLILAHHRLACLYARADSANSPEFARILHGAANRLLGEFRRLALAIRICRAASAWRKPARSPRCCGRTGGRSGSGG